LILLPTAPTLHAELPKRAARWLPDLERHLQEREWIACADFTVADIMMSSFLSGIRRSDLMESFSKAKAHCERRHVRPAWRRTLTLYAERLGINVDDFR
jgi:glutathione S-transferase